ncbi:MAG TPA: alpha-N-arabinofuranosidase [Povalibacter sp.]|nr:alpha-N-arabinofuranosidase [Povalibacter sp.]
MKSRIVVDRDFVISTLDRRVFGTFVEHMGRCVYGGIYEPGHPTADKHGFRQDVLELTKELGPTIVRYPGGNFLSGYNWEDGVGPKDKRPTRLDLAWGSTETNQFGTNEFMDWCRIANVEPMFAVNMGTRGPDEARNFLEYCNHPGGTHYSDLRRAHGYEKPHNIRFWCIGNEMDGPWQICRKTATEYGRIAQETGKVMRWVDADVQLAACGSSQRAMPTYASWEYEVLDHCFNEVDFISLHAYFRNDGNNIQEFFTVIEDLNSFIREVAAICDAVAAKRRSPRRIQLSLDEWNVWYKAHTPADLRKPGWPQAPKLIEEIYNFEDALIVGGALITMINNADRVKAACLAQLVNVIGPIMTETGGAAWRQTIFHPFAQASRYGRGEVLRAKVDTPTFSTATHPDLPFILASVIHDPESGAVSVLALNRHTTDEIDLEIELRGLGARKVTAASELHHHDLKAINSRDKRDEVAPRDRSDIAITGETLRAKLKPLSWNVIATARA